jgi:hypothetical protein
MPDQIDEPDYRAIADRAEARDDANRLLLFSLPVARVRPMKTPKAGGK